MSHDVLILADLVGNSQPDRDGFVRFDVSAGQWVALARACHEGHQDLLSLWAEGTHVRMALRSVDPPLRGIVTMTCPSKAYPSVGQFHAPAIRLERAMRDLKGVDPEDLPDTRGWLDHGKWPDSTEHNKHGYVFLPVEGDGLHQIPVGPVHAGIIEPGHFRFTANGETVVRLEERLGYVHKGIEALVAGTSLDEAARLVARISGDSTVAYSFAFARAVEAACDAEVPDRAIFIRGIMAELERIAHHINDFGGICNDASVVAINAHCTLLREKVLQVCSDAFGHRLMMDCIAPGGVEVDLDTTAETALYSLMETLEREFATAVKVYDESPSIQNRTVTTGFASPQLAARFAAGGFVGRASGRDFDCRRDAAYAPYDELAFTVPVRSDGDVNARAWIRVNEVAQSIAMVRELLNRLPPGRVKTDIQATSPGEGAALGEAFRGDVLLVVTLDEDGCIARFHARDASWFHWPLLEAAIEGNIVADFPLCNKSFNCSYSGHDM